MTAAVVALAVLAAGLGVLVAALVWHVKELHEQHDDDLDVIVAEQRRGDELQAREVKLANRVAILETDNHELERRLALAEEQRNAAAVKAADATADSIRNAPTAADALDEHTRELQRQQDALSGAADAAGADRSRDG